MYRICTMAENCATQGHNLSENCDIKLEVIKTDSDQGEHEVHDVTEELDDGIMIINDITADGALAESFKQDNAVPNEAVSVGKTMRSLTDSNDLLEEDEPRTSKRKRKGHLNEWQKKIKKLNRYHVVVQENAALMRENMFLREANRRLSEVCQILGKPFEVFEPATDIPHAAHFPSLLTNHSVSLASTTSTCTSTSPGAIFPELPTPVASGKPKQARLLPNVASVAIATLSSQSSNTRPRVSAAVRPGGGDKDCTYAGVQWYQCLLCGHAIRPKSNNHRRHYLVHHPDFPYRAQSLSYIRVNSKIPLSMAPLNVRKMKELLQYQNSSQQWLGGPENNI